MNGTVATIDDPFTPTSPDVASDDPRIHLIVLFGGRSAEHEVSCTTAAHVLAAADPQRYRITPIGISTEGRWAVADAAVAAIERGPEAIPGRLDPTGTPVSPTPVLESGGSSGGTTGTTVVLPLLHGPMGEDGTVQGLLELADVPYVGSGVLGSAVCMDKAMAKQVLAAAGVPQPRHRALAEHHITADTPAQLVDEFGLPCFVKPANMGSSVGVTKAHDLDELEAAIRLALRYDEWILVEEAVHGREIEVAVLGNLEPEASPAGEIVPGDEFYSYDDKYVTSAAELLVPAPLADDEMDRVRELALDAYRALRCEGLARVDFFYEADGRGFLCNEVNTMPGFTPISMFPKLWTHAGLSYSALIDRLVDLAIERHGRRRHTTDH